MHCHSEIIGISNEATVKDFRKAAVNFMKGYFVTDGYMGLVDGVYRLFADESDYYEYMNDWEISGLFWNPVLKYYLEDGSWIAARPSGTEPKCKFYFSIKGSDAKDASAKTEVFQKDMMNIIGE